MIFLWPSTCEGFQNNIITFKITHFLHTSFSAFSFNYLCVNYNLILLLSLSYSLFQDSTTSRHPLSKYLQSFKLLHEVSAYSTFSSHTYKTTKIFKMLKIKSLCCPFILNMMYCKHKSKSHMGISG